ncbi:MAG: redox-sensing transcriptional repressor Rex [Erysipelotrichaceae bacterium]|nr:redox-sensing transcriptional repressor Rex [Erysipelotrichaceae bacterium]
MKKKVSTRQLDRYPHYLAYLRKIAARGEETVSSPVLAEVFHCSEEQIRKDLFLVSRSSGKPGSGRSVQELIEDIEDFLGYHSEKKAVVIGAGNLGTAFLRYGGFRKAGIHVICGFDIDPDKIGKTVSDKMICDIDEIRDVVKKNGVTIAILTTPLSSAQEACDKAVEAGIKAIANFSLAHLQVPEEVSVMNIDLAASLAVLSRRMTEKGGNAHE